MDVEVPLHTELHINYGNGELIGTVRYCIYREIGYFLGLQFEDGSKWSQRNFRPQHLFDPRRLVNRSGGNNKGLRQSA